MSLKRVSACVFAVAASLAGCTGTGDVEYAGEVRVSSPELIELSPGIHVIADADEPLFYSDGFYWLYRDGYWMRSQDYRSGFVQVSMGYVPERVRMIERPHTYAQYRRHHGRNMQARATTLPRRTMQQPQPAIEPQQPAPIYPSQVQPPPGVRPPMQPGTTPPSTTYVPTESGLPPEPPGVAPDRVGPEPQRSRVPPADERDRTPPGQARDGVPPGQQRPQDRAVPPQPPRAQVRDEPKPQTPQQRGLTARPEDRGGNGPWTQDVKQDRGNPNESGDRSQERGNRSPIRAEDQPGRTADDETRDRKAEEKQDKKKPDK